MATNREDVVDLVVDLVDVDVDVDLVDGVLVDVDLVDVDLERVINKKEITTRAPDVRLTHRLVHSALVLKTTTSKTCLLYTSPSPRDRTRSRMPSSA